MEDIETDALVVGAGPAGLMAAEVMAGAGLRVLVADAMPSFGRKLLMAGRSGLNLTMDEPVEAFRAAFRGADWLMPVLREFGPAQVQDWARGLGVESRTRWRWLGDGRFATPRGEARVPAGATVLALGWAEADVVDISTPRMNSAERLHDLDSTVQVLILRAVNLTYHDVLGMDDWGQRFGVKQANKAYQIQHRLPFVRPTPPWLTEFCSTLNITGQP